MALDIKKLVATEEKQLKAHLDKALTAHLSSRAVEAEAMKRFNVRRLPLVPSREVEAFYINAAGVELKRMDKETDGYKVGYKVTVPKGKQPSVSATVEMKGQKLGGLSYDVRAGETIASIAKGIFGSEAFSSVIVDANPFLKKMPKEYRVPAGFPLTVPSVWTPENHLIVSAPVPSDAKEKAKPIPNPSAKLEIAKSKGPTVVFDLGPIIVTVELSVSAVGEVEFTGFLSPAVDLKARAASVKKELAGVTAEYSCDIRENKSNLNIEFVNRKFAGLDFKTSFSVAERKFKVSLGSKTIKGKLKDADYSITVTAEADIGIEANPKFSPKKARVPGMADEAWKAVIAKRNGVSEWIRENPGTTAGVTIGVIVVGGIVYLTPQGKVAAAIAALLGASKLKLAFS